jgi:hypothetical protein
MKAGASTPLTPVKNSFTCTASSPPNVKKASKRRHRSTGGPRTPGTSRRRACNPRSPPNGMKASKRRHRSPGRAHTPKTPPRQCTPSSPPKVKRARGKVSPAVQKFRTNKKCEASAKQVLVQIYYMSKEDQLAEVSRFLASLREGLSAGSLSSIEQEWMDCAFSAQHIIMTNIAASEQ